MAPNAPLKNLDAPAESEGANKHSKPSGAAVLSGKPNVDGANLQSARHKSPLGLAFERNLGNVLGIVVGIALLAELLVVISNLLARVLFGASLLWSQEVARLALAVLAFLGGALAYQRKQHMAVDVVLNRLPPAGAEVIRAFADLAVLTTGLGGVILSLPLLRDATTELTPILHISQFWFALPVTCGFALLAVFAGVRVVRHAVLPNVEATVVVLLAVAVLYGLHTSGAGSPLVVTLVLLLLLLAGSVPVGFSLALASTAFLYVSGLASPTEIPLDMQSGVSDFILLAVPFFILTGYLLTVGGLTEPLAKFADAVVGHVRGGLLHVIVVTMYVFSGISGAKVADVAAVGSAMKDMLEERDYDPAESTAVLSASAVMGETIPPSIAMIVLGSVTSISISGLFIAGVIPALFLGLVLAALIFWRHRHQTGLGKASSRTKVVATVRALPALAVPVMLVSGILFGLATATEVAAVAVVYALLIGFLGYRSLRWTSFMTSVGTSASMAGMILFIISTATPFAQSLTLAQVPQDIATSMGNIGGGVWVFLLASIIALIVSGQLLEGLPALIIFGPLLVPIATEFGINPLHYGIVLLFALGIGAFSPPVGVGLYVACAVGGVAPERVWPKLIPYMGALLVGLFIVTFVPLITLALPNLFGVG